MDENQAKELLDIIDNRIKKYIPEQADKRFSGKVISVGTGSATIQLSNDPDGNNIVVPNSRELPLEVNDEIYINAINGSLTNAFIDLRKSFVGGYIYTDFDTGDDINNNGSLAKPYKTLQRAASRLQKNLNGKYVTIKYNTVSSTENLVIANFYGGGTLRLSPLSAGLYRQIESISINTCTNISIINDGLGAIGLDHIGISIDQSGYVEIANVSITTDSVYDGVVASGASKIRLYNSTISNRGSAILCTYISTIFSDSNSGSGNDVGLFAFNGGEIVKNSTQPSGTTSEFTNKGGLIR